MLNNTVCLDGAGSLYLLQRQSGAVVRKRVHQHLSRWTAVRDQRTVHPVKSAGESHGFHIFRIESNFSQILILGESKLKLLLCCYSTLKPHRYLPG